MEINWISGKKTYIVAVATILYALNGAFLGFLEWETAMMLIFGALGISALRDGVKKAEVYD